MYTIDSFYLKKINCVVWMSLINSYSSLFRLVQHYLSAAVLHGDYFVGNSATKKDMLLVLL